MKKTIFLLTGISCLMALHVNAQGFIVYKNNGQVVIYQADEVKEIVTFGYGEKPWTDVEGGKVFDVNGVKFTMVDVEGGTFQMGSSSGAKDEQPVHNVTLSSYSIGQTEVTQALWLAVMDNNPSTSIGDDLPVNGLCRDDCLTFITKLNQITGEHFRLPTEAEWEYAARGGNKSQGYTYSGSNTIDDVAWYSDNSEQKTHEVKTKGYNELGLYDMSGNVWEWCQDIYGNYNSDDQSNPSGASWGLERVIRGGSWYNNAGGCRVTNRASEKPSLKTSLYFIGFRLAL